MKKIVLIMLTIILYTASVSSPTNAVSGSELMDSSSVRVTLIENEIIYEWEYDNPDHYEYEVGNTVQKGKEAQLHVRQLLSELQLNEQTTAEEYAERLKQRFPHLERLEIRWMNKDSKRFTWLWTK
ncbi:hypothetical protein [Shouchella patagoniensis]|uniref:hypothetical protein n=1 Tax=Shouchella patagoniensis TaxID=228576 RepID=UPI0009955911|nr:hypothetical protein [Shouchella patagoniensis]